MYDEFMQLRAVGEKKNSFTYTKNGIRVLEDANIPHTAKMNENETGKLLDQVLTISSVQSSLDAHRTLTRNRTRSKFLFNVQKLRCNQYVAYKLGRIRQSYENGLDQLRIENYDEYHFLIDVDDSKTLEFAGRKSFSYTKVPSGVQ